MDANSMNSAGDKPVETSAEAKTEKVVPSVSSLAAAAAAAFGTGPATATTPSLFKKSSSASSALAAAANAASALNDNSVSASMGSLAEAPAASFTAGFSETPTGSAETATLTAAANPTNLSGGASSSTAVGGLAGSTGSGSQASGGSASSGAGAGGNSSGSVVTNKMPAITEFPNISNYLDFRKFLSDYYSYRREISKKDLRPYNYAVFSAAANIKSPNYLKLIIEGRRNLSPDMIAKFSKAMGLPKEQAEEFRMLVLFGQASDPAERNMHLKVLNERRVNSKLKSGEIDQKTWEKIPSWISWILYTLVDQKDVKFDAESLRKTLREKANVDEIQGALDSLLQTGEIVKDAKTGEMKKARSLMESAEDVPVALVRKLQAELMYLGLESLFRDSATEREFGSATLALTKQEFEELRFQLRKIRKEAQKNIGVKRLSTKGDRVYQLNLQLFPVT